MCPYSSGEERCSYKAVVGGSNPSAGTKICFSGGNGIHAGLRNQFRKEWGFDSPGKHQNLTN